MSSHCVHILLSAVRAGQNGPVITLHGQPTLTFTLLGQAMLAFGNLKLALAEEWGTDAAEKWVKERIDL